MRMKACLGLVPGTSYQGFPFTTETLGTMIWNTLLYLPIPITIEFNIHDRLAGVCISLTACDAGGIDAELDLFDDTFREIIGTYAHVVPGWTIIDGPDKYATRLAMLAFTNNPAPCTLPGTEPILNHAAAT